MTLRGLRESKGLTQAACADYLQVPLRTYKRYEANEGKSNEIKYRYMIDKLSAYGVIDESHGRLTVGQIKDICGEVFGAYPVEFCYLFGSYAKGTETETSDVDLLISMPVDGLKYYELLELLRERLGKKVDLLDSAQLNNNPELIREVLGDGIKIYG